MTLAINGGAPVRTKFLSFSIPDIQEEDIEAAVDVMKSGWLSTGKEATKFEEAFIQYKGGNVGAVALSSCTAALHLALESIPVKGWEVIVPDMTFSATAAAVVHAGGIPVFADVNPVTQNITVESIRERITDTTKAVILVHFAGQTCQMNQIQDLCNEKGILIIEDCAHAIETTFCSIPSGTQNYAGCFSFYGTKNVTTAIGEGGMLISKHPGVVEFARRMSLHGMSRNAAERYGTAGFKHYDILAPGFKYNMSDVAAAFANSQLKRIDYNWAIRQSIWDRYNKAFSNLAIYRPFNFLSHNSKHAYHLYTFQIVNSAYSVDRDQILEALTAEGIGVGVHYKPLHTHTYWKRYCIQQNTKECYSADRLGKSTISLPLTPSMESQDVVDVITAVKKVLGYYYI